VCVCVGILGHFVNCSRIVLHQNYRVSGWAVNEPSSDELYLCELCLFTLVTI